MRSLLAAVAAVIALAAHDSTALSQSDANALAQYALSRLVLGGGVVALPRVGTGDAVAGLRAPLTAGGAGNGPPETAKPGVRW